MRGVRGVEVSTPAQGQRKNDLNIFHFSDICFFNESEDQLHSTVRCRHHRNTDSRKKTQTEYVGVLGAIIT